MDGSRPATLRLGRGATGFRHVGEPPLPETDPRACRAAWYAAARTARAQVTDFAEQQYPQSFHSAALDAHDGARIALFHAHKPLVAFVHERRGCYADEFAEPPAWAATLTHFGFTILSAPLLCTPFPVADASALSPAEREQIAYWQPGTVGAVLFNSWD